MTPFEEVQIVNQMEKLLLEAHMEQANAALESATVLLEGALSRMNWRLNKPVLRRLLSDDETIETWERIQKLQRIIDDVKYLAKPL